MRPASIKPVRCAIYTRVSTEHGLDQEFNSLDAQYDAASAYIKSQAHAGWALIRSRYDDGGYSGGSTDRPDLQRLLEDIRARKIDVIVVYKVDRLTRSLADFAKLVELFDAQGVSFVSVTQQFNTTTSMGRLTLNVLLSFAQFEREVTSERIRDKIAASKRKGQLPGALRVGSKGDPRHRRQLCDPQASEGTKMAGPASPLDIPLHTNLGVLAQRRRRLLRQTNKTPSQARRVPMALTAYFGSD